VPHRGPRACRTSPAATTPSASPPPPWPPARTATRTRKAQAERTSEQPQVRRTVGAVGQDAATHVAAAGEPHGESGEPDREGGDGQQRPGVARRQGCELLDPAKRGEPREGVQADPGVADHAQPVAGAEDGGTVARRGPPGGRQLAGEGAHGEEHDRRAHQGEGQEQGGPGGDADPGGDPDGSGDGRGERPQHGAGGGQAAQRLGRGGAPGGQPGEEQVPAAGLLLAPQQARAGQQSPDGARDGEGHRHLEHREAATVCSAGAGPNRAADALLAPKAAASRWRSASVR
jgi:hypothetical protein